MENILFNGNREITLIIIYDDKVDKEYADYLFDLISTKENINAACWTIKEYEQSKANVSSKNYKIFIGKNKLTQSKRDYIRKMMFNENGMIYGWLGKSAILYLNKLSIFKKEREVLIKLLSPKKWYSYFILLHHFAEYEKNQQIKTFLYKLKKQRYIDLIDIFYKDGLGRFLGE
jgi:hypothetical protein